MFFSEYRHIFAVRKPGAAIHFWVEKAFGDRPFGGVELHTSPNPNAASPVSAGRGDCWLLKGPCHHDGSSSMANEKFIPMFRRCNESGDFDQVYRELETLLFMWTEKDGQ
jgi:hypothetical protein